MKHIPRRVRSLRRGPASYRDDRLFIVACDDTYAPLQYFEFFAIPRVKIHVVSTTDGTSAARHVLDRLLAIDHESDDERWLVLDTDHCIMGTHQKTFLGVLKEARKKNVRIALSRPCFELWLLLHHVDILDFDDLKDAASVEEVLRNTLGQYNKTKLRRDDYPLGKIRDACRRAERLDASVCGGEIPKRNTTRVYLLVKEIINSSLPGQLPPEFFELVAPE